jgi:tripartite-type tricarboxylate transporter receptor subunit TctC
MRTAAAAPWPLAVLTAARAKDSYPSRDDGGPGADRRCRRLNRRMIGGKLSDVLGQPVVISKRAGPSGIIASDSVAKAAPDGYTLLLYSITTRGIGPHLYAHLPYDPMKDFTPVIFVAKSL